MVNKRLGSALSKGKAAGKSFIGRSKKRKQMEDLHKRRRVALGQNDLERVAQIDKEIAKLRRSVSGRFAGKSTAAKSTAAKSSAAKSSAAKSSAAKSSAARSTDRTTGDSTARSLADAVAKAAELVASTAQESVIKHASIHISVFLDTDDAVTTMRVVKATQQIAHELGYMTPVITEVERGSILASFKAYWGGDKGQQIIAESKAKAKEIVEEAEHYARLHVQEKQASVDATNVSSSVELMTAYADVPRVAVKIGAILFVKYPGPDGAPVVINRTLSTREINAYDRTPTIGSQPELVEQNLAFLLSQETEEQKAIEE
jgi:hypothetical protein